MKNLFITVFLFVFAPVTFAAADVNVDLYGGLSGAGDLERLSIVGLNLSMGIHRDVDLMLKTAYGWRFETGTPDDEKFTQMSGMVCLQHHFRITELPLVWINTVGAGGSKAGRSYNVSSIESDDEDYLGFEFALYTGILYHATQKLAPYLELGYHMMTSMLGSAPFDVNGFQALIGVRYTFGHNQSIFSDY